MHVCQAPLGGNTTSNTRRPLANCGFEPGRSTASKSSRRKSWFVYVERSSPRGRDPRGFSWPRGAYQAGIQLPSPDDLTSLDVEDVGEVRHDRDLDRESNGPRREVLEIVVLVDAVRDRAIESHAQRLALDGAVGVDQCVVGELEARRERLDGTRAEQDRPGAIDPQVVAGDEPGIPREDAVRLPGDPPVRLADQDPIVAVRRDRRRSDMDREG